MTPRPHGWRVALPDDPGVRDHHARHRGPFEDQPHLSMRGFCWLLYLLAVVAAVCVFARVW